MRALTATEISRLAERSIRARNLVWITAKDRDTAALQSIGFWDDVGTVGLQVRDPLLGTTPTRTFVGAGALLGLEDIVLTSQMAVKEVVLTLSQIDANVAQTVRGYDARLAPIQIYRGLFSSTTHNLVVAARCRFVGFIDEIEIVDPTDGREGRITVRATSQLRELTRSNPATASNQDQQRRDANDNFLRFANAVTGWNVPWGQRGVKTSGRSRRKNGRGRD